MTNTEQKLEKYIEKNNIEFIIWDFDLVIFKLDWTKGETSYEFLGRLYSVFNDVDPELILDKDEFIYRLFPYTEIDLYFRKYGKSSIQKVIELFKERELIALEYAKPNNEIINLIKSTDANISHAIWSNNNYKTIEYLLEKSGIKEKFEIIASLDNVEYPKPDVSGFEIINEKFGKPNKERILMVGDSLRSDKVAAENSGIKFFHYDKKL
ncbi:MAG TPA: HAD-IA family hydrolase [Candidatus Dojkabacteria bacterium]|nr:HAD-IA family hydrolase [Candidatus Dojkabacteria bacterium]HRO64701.1 HAD-IA family hydrolase [Candidatus Dojkabacteria bacterium]HRP37076.1 HAD-IA family hydrolase [Candidatus Dojkabacteria bacterium]HRP50668.1 HAD-IA family hydrolase [Candidatus Dojkabacteria bacterium]